MASQISAFIFAPSQIATATRIARIIDQSILPQQDACAVLTGADMLRAQMKQPAHPHGFAVLLAGNGRELELMATLSEWFEGVPLVLMVPDHCRKTIALAHQLRPRYLMGPQINYREMRIVLRKLFSQQRLRAIAPAAFQASTLIIPAPKKRYFLLKQHRLKIRKQNLLPGCATRAAPHPQTLTALTRKTCRNSGTPPGRRKQRHPFSTIK